MTQHPGGSDVRRVQTRLGLADSGSRRRIASRVECIRRRHATSRGGVGGGIRGRQVDPGPRARPHPGIGAAHRAVRAGHRGGPGRTTGRVLAVGDRRRPGRPRHHAGRCPQDLGAGREPRPRRRRRPVARPAVGVAGLPAGGRGRGPVDHHDPLRGGRGRRGDRIVERATAAPHGDHRVQPGTNRGTCPRGARRRRQQPAGRRAVPPDRGKCVAAARSTERRSGQRRAGAHRDRVATSRPVARRRRTQRPAGVPATLPGPGGIGGGGDSGDRGAGGLGGAARAVRRRRGGPPGAPWPDPAACRRGRCRGAVKSPHRGRGGDPAGRSGAVTTTQYRAGPSFSEASASRGQAPEVARCARPDPAGPVHDAQRHAAGPKRDHRCGAKRDDRLEFRFCRGAEPVRVRARRWSAGGAGAG
ncbi:hypothetical protein C1Y40_05386 [Mycobacterium talmoniae]|uniref:Uncharacterized protein n=1 Tax=Mycobacterium talmoniae TaxID=1858794 RepID=A0A2S8BCU4_9MYCO|nr:hypothetical protein C1Y40_05386 [Mycobacterium talmoniae]